MPLIAMFAEFIGTFALVFLGAGAAASGVNNLTAVAFAHGFALLAFALMLGHLSGAHYNPAVSFAMWLKGKIDQKMLGYYVASQMSAGVIAAVCLAFATAGIDSDLGSTTVSPSISIIQGFGIETLLTFLLAFVALRSSQEQTKSAAPFAIAATLVACILAGGNFTGASLNPARSLGPCIMSGNISQLWVYLTAPLLGAWIGIKADQLLHEE